MTELSTGGRRATWAEIQQHAVELRRLAAEVGVGAPHVRSDGTLVVASDEPGYRLMLEFAAAASDAVGVYVHVITDDVPGAKGTQPL